MTLLSTAAYGRFVMKAKVRNFLLDERIVDKDSFEDYKNNL